MASSDASNPFPAGGLVGKVALVTGSTSGIGLGIAETFAASGATVILNGLATHKEAEHLKTEMSHRFGVPVGFSGANMSKADVIQSMIEETIRDFGRIDILVNNAGIQHVAPLESFPPEKWDLILAINLTTAFHTIRLALPGMRERGFGRIINVASAHGLAGGT